MHSSRVNLYSRFERAWFWVQACLIVLLGITGLQVHGTLAISNFERAVELHGFCALSWMVLYVFTVFCLIVTREFKQLLWIFRRGYEVVTSFALGAFKGSPHAGQKPQEKRFNLLQRIVYITIKTFLLPFQMLTGILYYTHNDWAAWNAAPSLGTVALLHTAGLFALGAFSVVHIYMALTGHTAVPNEGQ